jgi:signal transduction histidine kinase
LDPINGTEKKWEIKDANGNRNSINNNILIYLSNKFERVTICSSSHAFIKKSKGGTGKEQKIGLGNMKEKLIALVGRVSSTMLLHKFM